MNVKVNLIPKNVIANLLLERLDYIKLEPKNILNMGQSSNLISKKLAKRFLQATIISKPTDIKAIKSNSINLIVSNCKLHLISNLSHLFAEMNRILCSNGMLLFSALETEQCELIALGDLMLNAQLNDPVVDREKIISRSGTFNIIYGHAWGKEKRNNNFYFDSNKIKHL